MSPMLPLLLSAWWAEMDHPHRIMDQNFGLGLYPGQVMFPSAIDSFYPASKSAINLYHKQLSDLMQYGDTGTVSVTEDKDTFKVILDVQQFKPDEITVKLAGKFIVVEAKHEEKKDEHGLISRQFSRKYLLPEEAITDQLSSNISSDGILMITAPMKPSEEKENERTIKIVQTGKPAIRIDTTESSTTPSNTVNPTTTSQESSNREETTEATDQQTPEK
ncbi:protein lethal(2)essential for life-like [Colletes gigas]|uniref:protein lethal(2)essential for life-like n=1 Tax=Colletes gigas TaxID=935657 RepID=UPI001C9B52CE|nr:protein lethal(2)essential for life-like [Colletes gigas]